MSVSAGTRSDVAGLFAPDLVLIPSRGLFFSIKMFYVITSLSGLSKTFPFLEFSPKSHEDMALLFHMLHLNDNPSGLMLQRHRWTYT